MLLQFLALLLFLLRSRLSTSQVTSAPFFSQPQGDVPLFNKIQFADFQGGNNDLMSGVDARKIIGPLMSPFMDMFDVMQRNVKARAYADKRLKCLLEYTCADSFKELYRALAVPTTIMRRLLHLHYPMCSYKMTLKRKFFDHALLLVTSKVAQEREDSPLSSSRSIFEMIERLNRPTTTTTPQPPLLERLIRPYLEPWQKQFNDLQKDVAGILPATTTTSPKITTTTRENLFAKSLQLFFPSVQEEEKPLASTTPTPPKLFDASMIEKLFFSRQKRDIHTRQKRQEDVRSPSSELSNPFTPNPLMSLFTTPKPLPELPSIKRPEFLDMPFPSPALPSPQYKLQDPFYNPLFPNRKNKLFDLLSGGEAVRLTG